MLDKNTQFEDLLHWLEKETQALETAMRGWGSFNNKHNYIYIQRLNRLNEDVKSRVRTLLGQRWLRQIDYFKLESAISRSNLYTSLFDKAISLGIPLEWDIVLKVSQHQYKR